VIKAELFYKKINLKNASMISTDKIFLRFRDLWQAETIAAP